MSTETADINSSKSELTQESVKETDKQLKILKNDIEKPDKETEEGERLTVEKEKLEKEIEKLKVIKRLLEAGREIDIPSFEVFEGERGFLYKDKKNVYLGYEGFPVKDVKEPSNFRVIDKPGSSSYGTDGENIYYFYHTLNSAKNNVERSGIVEGADIETFEGLGADFGRDKNNIYRFGKLYKPHHDEEIDIETFKVINFDFQIDKNHVYWVDNVVPGADPNNDETWGPAIEESLEIDKKSKSEN